MKLKSLIESNPFLSSPQYDELLSKSVLTSTAIEIGAVSEMIRKALQQQVAKAPVPSDARIPQ